MPTWSRAEPARLLYSITGRPDSRADVSAKRTPSDAAPGPALSIAEPIAAPAVSRQATDTSTNARGRLIARPTAGGAPDFLAGCAISHDRTEESRHGGAKGLAEGTVLA